MPGQQDRRSCSPRLRKALAGIHSLAVDVSDMRAIIRVEGDDARECCSRAVRSIFSALIMSAGTVRRVRFAEIAALLHVVSEKPDVIDLYVFRSYADYAWDWFLANARAEASIALFGRAGCAFRLK